MSGPAEHKAKLWADIIGDPDHPERGGIYMGKPAPQSRFLGCEHIVTEVKDADGGIIRRMEYNMQGFFEKCLDRWQELTGQDWRALPDASTPFLDEDLLRKNQGIGPLEFKLLESITTPCRCRPFESKMSDPHLLLLHRSRNNSCVLREQPIP